MSTLVMPLEEMSQALSSQPTSQHQPFLSPWESFPMRQRNAEDKDSCGQKHTGYVRPVSLLGVPSARPHAKYSLLGTPLASQGGGSSQLLLSCGKLSNFLVRCLAQWLI